MDGVQPVLPAVSFFSRDGLLGAIMHIALIPGIGVPFIGTPGAGILGIGIGTILTIIIHIIIIRIILIRDKT